MSNYRELAVWRKSHSVALDVYRVSLELPKTERYGLQAQMRRAAVSIGSNLAEGSGRASDRDFARFVSIAIGSASELEYQLELAEDLDFLERELAQSSRQRVVEVRKMLLALRIHLIRADSRLATRVS